MRLSTGPSELKGSYYTGNSFSALQSSQQFLMTRSPRLWIHWSPPRRINDTTPSCSALGPQLLHGHIGSPVLAGPTRNVTGEAMPTSLAEALTQLSFLEFVQRCNLLIAPLQPTQPLVPISSLDVAVQTTSPCEVSQGASTQTSDQSVSSLSFDVAVQTSYHGIHTSSLDAAVQTIPHSTLSQNVSTQMGSRSASSFSVDIFVQTPMRSNVLHDVATQLPLTEFFIGCIYSNDLLDRQNFVRQSLPPVQGPRALLQPPPGLEQSAPPPDLATYSHLLTTHGASTISFPSPALQPPVSTTHVGTHNVRSATSAKRRAGTALAGTHNPVGSDPRTGTGPFPKPRALVLPWSNFGNPSLTGLVTLTQSTAISCIINSALPFLQWNPGPARRNPTNIVSAACGKFHAVILQEASDHVPHISDQFMAYTDNTDLAILLNKDTFEPDPIVLTFKADSTSKGTWGMVLLIVRGLLRRPSLSGSPTVTLCSVHIHNVVAKKRDASTEPLQFLHAKMREHNVDFIGGDFNMSAFSTVSDVFSDPEFSAPGHSCLWGLGALEEQHRECTGFLIMPKRPYEWRVDSHGCYKFDNAALCLGPRDLSAHLPVFLHLRNTNLP